MMRAKQARDPMRAPLLLLPLLWACSGKNAVDSNVEESTPVGTDLHAVNAQNVIVLNIDTLRRDRLPFYGYERNTMPLLNDRPWAIVDGFSSTSGWTVPSTMSQLTGLKQHHHGLQDFHQGQEEPDIEGTLLSEHFQAQGFATALYTGNGLISDMPISFQAGFDSVEYIDADAESGNATHLVDVMLPYIESLSADQPFFIWFQPGDPHTPYDPIDSDFGTWTNPDDLPFSPQEEGSIQSGKLSIALGEATPEEQEAILQAVHDVYDEQLLELDRGLNNLLVGLNQMGRLDNTLIVFSSDHGEYLSDRGDLIFGHVGMLAEQLSPVALMFLHPELAAGTTTCVSSGTDFASTLLDMVQLPRMDSSTDGQSLFDGCRDAAVSAVWFSSTAIHLVHARTATSRAEYSCATGEKTYYNLTTDPDALSAVGRDSVDDPDALDTALEEFLNEVRTTVSADACGPQ